MKTNKILSIFATTLIITALVLTKANATVIPAPVVTSDNSTDANQDGPSTITSDPSVNPNQDSPSIPTPPSDPVTPPSNGGSSSGSFGGGSSFYTTPIVSTTSTSTGTTSPIVGGSCPLINNFLQIGADNNGADVIKLQAFLKTTEQLDVDLSDIFDAKTEAGVKSFQAKYLADTMGPWKAATPSGKVYITTKRKINEIACNSVINLTGDEQATISSYLNGNQNASTTIGSNPSTSTTTIGVNGNGSTNTASVANAPVIQRFWNFVKGIFGR